MTLAVQAIAAGKEFGSAAGNEPSPSRQTMDSTDTLSKDLAFLRERATRSESQQSDRHSAHKPSQQSDRKPRWEDDRRHEPKHQRQTFVRGQPEQLSIDEYDVGMERDDEEAEQRRQEKHQRELEASFRQVSQEETLMQTTPNSDILPLCLSISAKNDSNNRSQPN